MFKKTILFIGLLCTSFYSVAQENKNNYDFKPEFDVLADSMIYFHNHQNDKKAAAYFKLLTTNYSPLPEVFYINAGTIYKRLATNAETQPSKFAYADTLLSLYDQRIELFGDTLNLTNRKLFEYFLLTKEYKDKQKQIFALYNNFFRENSSGLTSYNFFPYAYLASLLYKSGQLDENNYLKVIQNLKSEIASKPSTSEWINIKGNIEKLNAI